MPQEHGCRSTHSPGRARSSPGLPAGRYRTGLSSQHRTAPWSCTRCREGRRCRWRHPRQRASQTHRRIQRTQHCMWGAGDGVRRVLKRLAGISRLAATHAPVQECCRWRRAGRQQHHPSSAQRHHPRQDLPGAVITVRAPGTGQTANVVVHRAASLLHHAIPSLADKAVGRACGSSTSL